MIDTLPKFDSPPLIETILGVEFEPLWAFEIPYFGLFWSRIRENYPNSLVQPPLDSSIETFGASQRVINLKWERTPDVRCWFSDLTTTWLIQIQKTRFINNWRATGKDKTSYPHYEKVRQRFLDEWLNFNNFLEEEKIGQPPILQCEIAYVNHIETEPQLSNLHEIFPSLEPVKKVSDFLSQPEAIVTNFVYVIPENRGRLYLEMQPVFRHADLREVLQLRLTAKVLPKSSNNDDMIEAFDIGREWAVRSFTDFTSEEMHKHWQRRQ